MGRDDVTGTDVVASSTQKTMETLGLLSPISSTLVPPFRRLLDLRTYPSGTAKGLKWRYA
jgi:hypothetical protein